MKTIPIKVESPLPSTCASSALVALQVLDDSMAPEFQIGQVAIVDASARLNSGSYVLVQVGEHKDAPYCEEDSGLWMIRRWNSIDAATVTLETLNQDWADVVHNIDDVQVLGVVVQRAGRRRRDRQHYR